VSSAHRSNWRGCAVTLVQLLLLVLVLLLLLLLSAAEWDVAIGFARQEPDFGLLLRACCSAVHHKPAHACLRLTCALRGALQLQYTGEVPDSHEFGANFATGKVLQALCPPGKGIARVQWRRGELAGKDDQAWRPSGMQLYCGTE
jgi:hypothetical protein